MTTTTVTNWLQKTLNFVLWVLRWGVIPGGAIVITHLVDFKYQGKRMENLEAVVSINRRETKDELLQVRREALDLQREQNLHLRKLSEDVGVLKGMVRTIRDRENE